MGESTIGELEELIINTDIFNNSKKIQGSYNTTTAIFKNTHINKLIILDGKASHKLDISTNDSGLFYYDEDIKKVAGVENVIIDDGITELGTESLRRLGIKNITLPNTITTIGIEAFDENQLTSLTIPASVETIGRYAFSGNLITAINFEPNSKLKTIGKFVFEGNKLTNTGLSKLPSSLTSLATSAFYRNPNLTQITLTFQKTCLVGQMVEQLMIKQLLMKDRFLSFSFSSKIVE